MDEPRETSELKWSRGDVVSHERLHVTAIILDKIKFTIHTCQPLYEFGKSAPIRWMDAQPKEYIGYLVQNENVIKFVSGELKDFGWIASEEISESYVEFLKLFYLKNLLSEVI